MGGLREVDPLWGRGPAVGSGLLDERPQTAPAPSATQDTARRRAAVTTQHLRRPTLAVQPQDASDGPSCLTAPPPSGWSVPAAPTDWTPLKPHLGKRAIL